MISTGEAAESVPPPEDTVRVSTQKSDGRREENKGGGRMTGRMSPNRFFPKRVRPLRDEAWLDVMSPRLWLPHVACLGFFSSFLLF